MDPNANLKKQLELAAEILALAEETAALGAFDRLVKIGANAQILAELVEALDGWIRKGGFLPERWHRT